MVRIFIHLMYIHLQYISVPGSRNYYWGISPKLVIFVEI